MSKDSDKESLGRLTDFQLACSKAVAKLFSSSKMSYSLTLIEGMFETYLVCRTRLDNKDLTAYIYFDEAGFFFNSTWNIWESQDFRASSELKREFLAALHELIVSGAR